MVWEAQLQDTGWSGVLGCLLWGRDLPTSIPKSWNRRGPEGLCSLPGWGSEHGCLPRGYDFMFHLRFLPHRPEVFNPNGLVYRENLSGESELLCVLLCWCSLGVNSLAVLVLTSCAVCCLGPRVAPGGKGLHRYGIGLSVGRVVYFSQMAFSVLQS